MEKKRNNIIGRMKSFIVKNNIIFRFIITSIYTVYIIIITFLFSNNNTILIILIVAPVLAYYICFEKIHEIKLLNMLNIKLRCDNGEAYILKSSEDKLTIDVHSLNTKRDFTYLVMQPSSISISQDINRFANSLRNIRNDLTDYKYIVFLGSDGKYLTSVRTSDFVEIINNENRSAFYIDLLHKIVNENITDFFKENPLNVNTVENHKNPIAILNDLLSQGADWAVILDKSNKCVGITERNLLVSKLVYVLARHVTGTSNNEITHSR